MNIANIVVATDLSDNAGAAARWAQSFKERLGATVVVAHVLELGLKTWLDSAFEVLEVPETVAAAEAKIAAWYEQQTGVAPDDATIRAGTASVQLGQVVGEQSGETLLVAAATGRGAFSQFLVGSTATAVASQPPCPVVVVHPDHTTIDAILVATDLSSNGRQAVATAAALARRLDLSLDIVHAYGAVDEARLIEITPNVQAHAKIAIREIEGQPGLDGIDRTIFPVASSPLAAILEVAENKSSNLIVLGHSGESRLAQVVLGSVAKRVLKRMPCSVMIVPGQLVD